MDASDFDDDAAMPAEVADWLRRGAELMGRSLDVTRQLQSDWDEMAVGDRDWSTDTIMNEVVNSWEHFTPVMGEWIQHGVDGTAIALRSFFPQTPDMLRAMSDRLRATPAGDDAATYLDVSAEATDRMIGNRYTSADVVEDWANLVGKLTKDAWAAAAKARRAQPRF